MKFIDYIKSKLIGKESYEISADDFDNYYQSSEASKFNVTQLALFTAIDLIARTLAKCEFVTVEDNKSIVGSEYYLWNYAPNKHQTKIEFLTEAVSRLFFANELLIFETSDGQLLVADGFSKTEYAVYDDIFTAVSARNWTSQRSYLSSEVIYLKYNNTALCSFLANMCDSYEQLMVSAQERYNKAIGHKGILKIKAQASNATDFQEKFQKMMSENFKTYFNAQNAVLPLYDGYEYSEPSTDANKSTNSEINDITKLRSEAYNAVGNALHIPPAIIAGTASQLSDSENAFIANAIDPLAQMFEEEITKKRYGEKSFINGSYMLIDTTTARHIDAISSANNLDKAIASGLLSPYQAQKYCNMLPFNDEWATTHYMTKNYQTADIAVKGGENDDK